MGQSLVIQVRCSLPAIFLMSSSLCAFFPNFLYNALCKFSLEFRPFIADAPSRLRFFISPARRASICTLPYFCTCQKTHVSFPFECISTSRCIAWLLLFEGCNHPNTFCLVK